MERIGRKVRVESGAPKDWKNILEYFQTSSLPKIYLWSLLVPRVQLWLHFGCHLNPSWVQRSFRSWRSKVERNGTQRSQKGAEGSQKGAKRETKGTKKKSRNPKRAKRQQCASKMDAKLCYKYVQTSMPRKHEDL